MASVLVIEDDLRIREVVTTALVAAGHAVRTEGRGAGRRPPLPPHRPRRRHQARAPGGLIRMRRRLLLVTLAVTTLLVAAFAVPLGLLVRDVARDRAITGAERDSAALAPVLAATTEPALLEEAVERTAAGAAGRLTVWLRDGTVVGEQHPADDDGVTLARDRQVAFSSTRGDSVDVYTPVVVEGGVVVLVLHIPPSLLYEGVPTAWAILAGLAVALLALAVLVSDRLARTVTRPAVDLAATSRALAAGDTSARAAHTPDGAPCAVTVTRQGSCAVRIVEDGGPGVSVAAAVARGTSSAGSTELGLDIASRAARDAGGDLRVERSAMGGARVVLDLPLAPEVP